jgi:hypothetical protein
MTTPTTPEPPRAIVVNEPSQEAINRAYAFMDEMAPVIAVRRAEREAAQEKKEEVDAA